MGTLLSQLYLGIPSSFPMLITPLTPSPTFPPFPFPPLPPPRTKNKKKALLRELYALSFFVGGGVGGRAIKEESICERIICFSLFISGGHEVFEPMDTCYWTLKRYLVSWNLRKLISWKAWWYFVIYGRKLYAFCSTNFNEVNKPDINLTAKLL